MLRLVVHHQMSLRPELERNIPDIRVPTKPDPAQKNMAALWNEVARNYGVFHGDMG
jgi:hypothetical protein